MRKKYGITTGGGSCVWDWPLMSWTEWQQMLLGMMHGAQMIDEVVKNGQLLEGYGPVVAMAELDRDAILNGYELLKEAGKALEQIPGVLERAPVQ